MSISLRILNQRSSQLLALKKLTSVKIILLAIFSLVILTGCGGGKSSPPTAQGQDFGTDSGATEDNTVHESPWTASDGDDGSGYTASCNFSGDENTGDLVSCKIYWDAQNTSTIPQEYYGFSYLVVDGATYQSSDKYADQRTVNPNSYATNMGGYSTFYIPYAGQISNLFKADGPNDIHLLDLPLNINVTSG